MAEITTNLRVACDGCGVELPCDQVGPELRIYPHTCPQQVLAKGTDSSVDDYVVGVNGCNHDWRHVAVEDKGPAGDPLELEVKWCAACGCLAREMLDDSWDVLYPDVSDDTS